MPARILASSLLLLVLLRSWSAAGAIGDRRRDGSSLAEAPRMSDIVFPDPKDSLPPFDPYGAAGRELVRSQQQGTAAASSAAPGPPEAAAATAAPPVRPLLDEDKLVGFQAAGGKTPRPPASGGPPSGQPSESPASSAPPPGAASEPNWSGLADILKELLNETGDPVKVSTPRPVSAATVPQPAPVASDADADKEFDMFLPHLQEALLTALQKEASEKRPPPVTTRRPPPTPDHAEDLFEDIIPALQQEIGGILETSKDDQPTPVTTPPARQPNPSPPPHPTLPTSSEFDDFMPELERVFSDILHSSEADADNGLGTKPKRPGTAQKPLSPGHGKPSNASTESSPDSSDQLLQALESSLADILKDETSRPPAPVQKPANIQENLVVPQAKIVRVLDKYYPQLKKLLEEIVEEEEAISSEPSSPRSQSSRSLDGVEHKATVQALYKTVQGIFGRHNNTSI